MQYPSPSRPAIFIFAIFLVVILGIVDYVTGYEIAFSIDTAPGNIHEAIKLADDAMYHAKNTGKNRIEYKRYISRKELVAAR